MIRDESSGALLGRSLGTGLGEGLAALLDSKMKAIQKSNFADLLGKGGYDKDNSNLLTELAQRDPKNFYKYISALSQEQAPIEGEAQSESPTFKNKLAQGINTQNAKNTVKEKHYDDLIAQRQNLEDVISTSKNMLESLKKGINTGVIASLGAKWAPSWVGENSENFDKESAHLVNLAGSQLKGPASRYRIALLEKEKPSLAHSPKVNEQILKRFIQKAESNLKDMNERYPELVGLGVREDQPQQQETPAIERVKQELYKKDNPSKYPDGTEGKYKGYIFEVKNGEFVYKGKI